MFLSYARCVCVPTIAKKSNFSFHGFAHAICRRWENRKLGDPRIPLDDAAEELAVAAQFAGAYGSPCRAIDEDGAERLTVRPTGREILSHLDCISS